MYLSTSEQTRNIGIGRYLLAYIGYWFIGRICYRCISNHYTLTEQMV